MSMHEHRMNIEQRMYTVHIAWTLNRECMHRAWTLNRACTHCMNIETYMNSAWTLNSACTHCILHENWTVHAQCMNRRTLNSARPLHIAWALNVHAHCMNRAWTLNKITDFFFLRIEYIRFSSLRSRKNLSFLFFVFVLLNDYYLRHSFHFYLVKLRTDQLRFRFFL